MAKYIKNYEKPVQKYRFAIQTIFVLISLWIGIEFYLFAQFLESGGAVEFFAKPSGAEAFLPISALMSFYYFIISGNIHGAHPAGLFIFLGIIGVSIAFGKSFCSWICPVGFISEMVGDFGEKLMKKIFKRKIKIPKLIDYPLRSLKYILLAFFAYAIFSMTKESLLAFLDSPYNKMADVKMWYFFADISKTSLIVISSLFIISIFIRSFWCRYLCPYGALLGLISFLSPNKIKRNESTCIDCSLCAKACPSSIKVDKVKTVISDECTSCMSCVDACPVKDTLYVENVLFKKKTKKKFIAIGVVAIYLIVIGYAMLSGNWESKMSKNEYLLYYKNLNSLDHPKSASDVKRLNEETREKNSK